MAARQVKSLTLPDSGYRHRGHRSRKSIKGLNVPHKRIHRIMRIQRQGKQERKFMQIFLNLKAQLTH